MSLSVLIVDHSAQQRDLFTRVFETRGDTVRTAASGSEAHMAFAEHAPDVTLVALPLPDDPACELPLYLLDEDPQMGLILMIDSWSQSSPALSATRRGAVICPRPLDVASILMLAENLAEARRMRAELQLRRSDGRALAPLPLGVDMLIDLASKSQHTPVLIVGEPGSGKGIVARLIHDLSPRSTEPFIELKCSSTTPVSFERALFGSERGVDGSEPESTLGMLELADRGTLFLRSVGRMPFPLQERLLEVVEEHQFRRAGGAVQLKTGARVIVGSDRPLAAAVDAGLFRSDLFYRLQVLTIALPPLRERMHEFDRLVTALTPNGSSISSTALAHLRAHTWPGNLRELSDQIWRATVAAGAGAVVEPQHLDMGTVLVRDTPASGLPTLSLSDLERDAIVGALRQTAGNKMQAAKVLGIARSTLHERLKRLKITPPFVRKPAR